MANNRNTDGTRLIFDREGGPDGKGEWIRRSNIDAREALQRAPHRFSDTAPEDKPKPEPEPEPAKTADHESDLGTLPIPDLRALASANKVSFQKNDTRTTLVKRLVAAGVKAPGA